MSKLKAMTDDAIKEVAMDLYKNRIFCDRHIPHEQRSVMIPLIFMPVALGAFKDFTEAELKDIGMLYQSYDEAVGRGINGFPTFMSVQVMSITDTEKVFEIVKQLTEAENKVIGGSDAEEKGGLG